MDRASEPKKWPGMSGLHGQPFEGNIKKHSFRGTFIPEHLILMNDPGYTTLLRRVNSRYF